MKETEGAGEIKPVLLSVYLNVERTFLNVFLNTEKGELGNLCNMRMRCIEAL